MAGMSNGLLIVMLLAAQAAAAPAGTVSGSVTVGSGWLDNPIGLSNESSAGYMTESLRLASRFGVAEGSAFRIGYEGSANQFTNDVDLGSMRHGVGLEWFLDNARRTTQLSSGVQGSVRTFDERYAHYDNREVYGYVAFKRYLDSALVLRGFGAARWRVYDDLPEESFVEPFGQLSLQRFFASRTTLGLAVRYGAKIFNDSVASSVWGTTDLPSTSQLAARLNFAQGFSDRLAWRGWVESRHSLSEFPRYVAEDVYDSPLLDVYAHEGTDLFTALKLLGPWQTWLEAGFAYGDHDYGELLFATADGGGRRQDDVREYVLALERRFTGASRPRLRISGGWRDQDSTLDGYTYQGVFASSSLSLQF